MHTSQEHLQLGQFIPLVYHFNMLADQTRMRAFKEAITLAVPIGSKVLELGGGTGVLSYFAAQRAAKVWCVEYNPEMVNAARNILAMNPSGERVEVMEVDAFNYLPPEPVDVVICEMLHVGMLREKQIPVLESFKQRYLNKFGVPLPRFIPEAFAQALQPVQQSFDYSGYYAPTPFFQDPDSVQHSTTELGSPVVYQLLSYDGLLPTNCAWQGEILIEKSGQLNALRFITKNVLAIDEQQSRSIDWFSQYLVLPLAKPIEVEAGNQLTISFSYQPGDPISALTPLVTIHT